MSERLGQLTNLQDLRLGRNDIGGPIPTSFYTLPDIIDFRLEENKITGTLSNALEGINETLRRIYLNDNLMTGPLPIVGIEFCTNMSKCSLFLHTIYSPQREGFLQTVYTP